MHMDLQDPQDFPTQLVQLLKRCPFCNDGKEDKLRHSTNSKSVHCNTNHLCFFISDLSMNSTLRKLSDA